MVAERRKRCVGARLGICRRASLLSPQPALGAGDRPGRRTWLYCLGRPWPARQPARALCPALASRGVSRLRLLRKFGEFAASDGAFDVAVLFAAQAAHNNSDGGDDSPNFLGCSVYSRTPPLDSG